MIRIVLKSRPLRLFSTTADDADRKREYCLAAEHVLSTVKNFNEIQSLTDAILKNLTSPYTYRNVRHEIVRELLSKFKFPSRTSLILRKQAEIDKMDMERGQKAQLIKLQSEKIRRACLSMASKPKEAFNPNPALVKMFAFQEIFTKQEGNKFTLNRRPENFSYYVGLPGISKSWSINFLNYFLNLRIAHVIGNRGRLEQSIFSNDGHCKILHFRCRSPVELIVDKIHKEAQADLGELTPQPPAEPDINSFQNWVKVLFGLYLEHGVNVKIVMDQFEEVFDSSQSWPALPYFRCLQQASGSTALVIMSELISSPATLEKLSSFDSKMLSPKQISFLETLPEKLTYNASCLLFQFQKYGFTRAQADMVLKKIKKLPLYSPYMIADAMRKSMSEIKQTQLEGDLIARKKSMSFTKLLEEKLQDESLNVLTCFSTLESLVRSVQPNAEIETLQALSIELDLLQQLTESYLLGPKKNIVSYINSAGGDILPLKSYIHFKKCNPVLASAMTDLRSLLHSASTHQTSVFHLQSKQLHGLVSAIDPASMQHILNQLYMKLTKLLQKHPLYYNQHIKAKIAAYHVLAVKDHIKRKFLIGHKNNYGLSIRAVMPNNSLDVNVSSCRTMPEGLEMFAWMLYQDDLGLKRGRNFNSVYRLRASLDALEQQEQILEHIKDGQNYLYIFDNSSTYVDFFTAGIQGSRLKFNLFNIVNYSTPQQLDQHITDFTTSDSIIRQLHQLAYLGKEQQQPSESIQPNLITYHVVNMQPGVKRQSGAKQCVRERENEGRRELEYAYSFVELEDLRVELVNRDGPISEDIISYI